MADINELYPSKWLKAADLKGRQLAVTIEKVELEDVGDEVKPVVYFAGHDKGLVANKTNALSIADITGSTNTDDWHGHKIILFSQKVNFQGKIQDALRVMAPAVEAKPSPRRTVAVQHEEPETKVDF